MSDRSRRNPSRVFTVAVSCGLALWLALGLLIFERL